MKIAEQLRHTIADNQIVIVLAALIMGMVFPAQLKPLAPFSTPFLMLIFFTSSLRLSLGELMGFAKDWRLLLLANAVMLIVMPLVMWLPLRIYAPEWALSFLIVGAMPTGLTIALIADLFGGKTSLAMLVSATTSLLAPLTVPFVFWLVLGQTIPIPVVSLFTSLVLTIVFPFALAMVVKAKAKKFVERHDFAWREISLLLFGLLVAGIVADAIQGSSLPLQATDLTIVAVMLVFMGGVAWLAYAIASWRTPSERITIALCMVYMNNTLALYIGDRFFHDQHIIPQLLIILTAVNALLLPIKWAAGRVIRKKKTTRPRIAHPVF